MTDEGGSFWSTFNAGAQSLSALEELLQDENCNVGSLLDQEDIIQEVRSSNTALLKRLTKVDALLFMVDLLTSEPPADASKERSYRQPFIVVELMTGPNASLTEALAASPEAFEKFWTFVEGIDENPVLVGYFTRVTTCVLTRHPRQVQSFLGPKGDVLGTFLRKLHSRSIADLLTSMYCAEEPVLPTDGLASKLLPCLQNSEMQEHVVLIFLELLSQKEGKIATTVLQQLTTPDSIRFLMDLLQGEGPAKVHSAASILSTMIAVACGIVDDADGQRQVETAGLRTKEPELESSLAGDDEKEALRTRADSDDEVGVLQRGSPKDKAPQEGAGALKREEAEAFLEQVAVCFTRPPALLVSELSSVVGQARLSLVSLLRILAKANSSKLLKVMQKFISEVAKLFLIFPWNTLLHNAVRSFLSEIMSSSESPRPELVATLLRDGSFKELLVSTFPQKTTSESFSKPAKVGYVGHLQFLCNQLAEYAEKVGGECKQILLTWNPHWQDVVLASLSEIKAVQDAPLGAKADKPVKKSRDKSEDDDTRTILADPNAPDPPGVRDRGSYRTILSGAPDPPRGRDRGGFKTIMSSRYAPDPPGVRDQGGFQTIMSFPNAPAPPRVRDHQYGMDTLMSNPDALQSIFSGQGLETLLSNRSGSNPSGVRGDFETKFLDPIGADPPGGRDSFEIAFPSRTAPEPSVQQTDGWVADFETQLPSSNAPAWEADFGAFGAAPSASQDWVADFGGSSSKEKKGDSFDPFR